MRRNKTRTYRRRVKDCWAAVYFEEIDPGVVNLGCCVHKSKRAQNDWYKNRKNKRVKSVEKYKSKIGITGITECYRIFKKVEDSTKRDKVLFIYSVSEKNAKAIDRYFSKLGFMSNKTGIDYWTWIKLPSKYT